MASTDIVDETAAVVGRLNAEIEAAVNAAGPGMPAGAAMRQLQFLLEDARNLIERLSRERDTGVPEGFVVVPRVPTDDMLDSVDGASSNSVIRAIVLKDYRALLSAAPQPPTVSTQGWQDIADPVKQADKDVEVLRQALERRSQPDLSTLTRELGDVHEWKYLWKVSDILVDATGHPDNYGSHDRAVVSVAEEADEEIATLTRERDQAREALANLMRRLDDHFGGVGRSYDWKEQEVARSVLHPEKEEKA